MKVVKKILFVFALMAGLSAVSMAQKGGDGPKTPPKQNPPVVVPREKPPPQNPPKGGDKPKKPGFALFIKRNEFTNEIA